MNVLGVIQVWHFKHSPASQTSKCEIMVEYFNIKNYTHWVTNAIMLQYVYLIYTKYSVVHNINNKRKINMKSVVSIMMAMQHFIILSPQICDVHIIHTLLLTSRWKGRIFPLF